ncbi:methionine-rich copper-binding protein CopC [Brevibacterium paucivorans]|uniref:Methionine-rich copper-binding protein CopC n=1 Tax=Brevibacterium paucivorans TaxID=170994 RepID=A0ABS2SLX7_9MICO|nr:copper resistance CopC family protein [Brevibacterium paucivorans]MBM7816293.1 methionine-rich copper-binding protein CopC [Brevibacterium paucivorans]
MTHRSALSLLLSAVLTLVIGSFGLMSASPALAHDQLIGSNPKNGAQLDKQPEWLELEFSGNIQEVGTEIQVNHNGKDVSAGEIAVEGRKVTSALPDDLEPGDYEVVWRVVSEDGHPVSGTVKFTIKDSNAAGGTTSENEGDNTATEAPAQGTGDNNANDENKDNASEANADSNDASATAGENSNGMSPIAYVVIALGAIAVVALVIVMFRRKSRGLEQ